MTLKVHKTDDPNETSLGEITIDLRDPIRTYSLDNGIEMKIEHYYPDYVMEDGEPRSETNFPRNKAFVFYITGPEAESREVSFIGIGKNIDATGKNKYKLGFEGIETLYVSGLTVRRDYTIPLFVIGAGIFMIGVVQGMY